MLNLNASSARIFKQNSFLDNTDAGVENDWKRSILDSAEWPILPQRIGPSAFNSRSDTSSKKTSFRINKLIMILSDLKYGIGRRFDVSIWTFYLTQIIQNVIVGHAKKLDIFMNVALN